jgi:hypothetical protein
MSLKRSRIIVIGASALAFLWIITAETACKQAAQPPAPGEKGAPPAMEGNTIIEGLNDVTGTVKSAFGKYFYVSELPGFDFVANGKVENGDTSSLLGKDVKVKALFRRENSTFLVVQSIDVKEGTGYRNVFNSTETALPEECFNQKARTDYEELKITNITKSADWEGKSKGKVHGKLITGADGKMTGISILGDGNKELAKVIVDNVTEYADYYLKKLRLFDTYWLYLNIKESVPANARAKAKEIFHADLVFIGLY